MTTPPPPDEWIVPTGVPDHSQPPLPEEDPRPTHFGWKVAAGIVAVGVLIGVGATVAVSESKNSSRVAGSPSVSTSPSSAPTLSEDDRRGRGLPGEQRLQGTLTALGPSSVTVRTVSGTATYTVTSSTEILRDGVPATLAELKVGDAVFMHVYPASTGGPLQVERIFTGTMPFPRRDGGFLR
jgi:hypothetical protein